MLPAGLRRDVPLIKFVLHQVHRYVLRVQARRLLWMPVLR